MYSEGRPQNVLGQRGAPSIHPGGILVSGKWVQPPGNASICTRGVVAGTVTRRIGPKDVVGGSKQWLLMTPSGMKLT
jgi:hypothetical protein